MPGAATHNTTLTGDHYEVCGDYAGFAQTFLQEKYPKTQAMFMIGCAGDSNPYPRGTMKLAREHGAIAGGWLVVSCPLNRIQKLPLARG